MIQTSFSQNNCSCDAGVYLTKEDFIANRLSYKINTGIKGYAFKFPMPADWKLTIKITNPDTTLKFKPGTIYGYYYCGSVFRYSPGVELYAPEDYYKIMEAGGIVIYTSVFVSGDEPFYSINLTSPIHRLNLKNLEKDFNDQPAFVTAVKYFKKKEELKDIAKRDDRGDFIINKIYEETIRK